MNLKWPAVQGAPGWGCGPSVCPPPPCSPASLALVGRYPGHCPQMARIPEEFQLQCPSLSFCLRGKEGPRGLGHFPENPAGCPSFGGQRLPAPGWPGGRRGPSPPRRRPALPHTQWPHPQASWVKVLDDSLRHSSPYPNTTFGTLKWDTERCGPSMPCKTKVLNGSYVRQLQVIYSRSFHRAPAVPTLPQRVPRPPFWPQACKTRALILLLTKLGEEQTC